MFARSLPYDFFGGMPRTTSRYDLEARRRRQHDYALRQEQLRQEAIGRRKQEVLQQQKLREKQARFHRYNKAAIVIQTAFRTYQARKKLAQENAAAIVIQRFMPRAAACISARKIVEALRQVRSIGSRVESMSNDYNANPFGYRSTLYFTDQLEKLLMSLDAVNIHRSPFVRGFRKHVVHEAQCSLRYADIAMKTLHRCATILQRNIRRHQRVQEDNSRQKAAFIVTRAVRNTPYIRDARKTAASIKVIRSHQEELNRTREEYEKAMQNIIAAMDGISAHEDIVDDLRRGTKRSAETDLELLQRGSLRL